ncbi:alpha-hydroxy-acid oxidizing protein [Paraperlucidibaca wandonensis]|uniref:Alpha-hydroxy-acid oxidizing protein n=1 Tax=Paraperlucidibaca wandonensis TaxID=1268273 RepID=A0ABW3HDU9_9GAMM
MPQRPSPLTQIPADIVCAEDYERWAERNMSSAVFAHLSEGSVADTTLRANRRAFERHAIYNRILVAGDHGSTELMLCGQRFRHPFLLAPVAHQGLFHADAELASAQAANALEAGLVLSTLSSTRLEEVAAQTQAPRWFQLYFQASKNATLSLVRRAEAAGYGAIVVTLDVPVHGVRRSSQRLGFTLPAHLNAVNLKDIDDGPTRAISRDDSTVFQGYMADAPTWEDLAWLLKSTTLPVLVKGVTHPDDALRLQSLGVAGIIVSTHGGRALDGGMASLDALPAIRQAVGPDLTLLLDSGVRSGTDVFKAIALGANAVMIGRPYIYALATAGALGVAHLLRILRDELEITMAQAGCLHINDIGPHTLFSPSHLC